MSTLEALSRILGPLAGFAVVGVLMLLLRWTYGGRRQSLVERRARIGASGNYGLLVAVSAPASLIEAELQRRQLEDAGIRANVVTTSEGARLMVFPEDERIARALLAA